MNEKPTHVILLHLQIPDVRTGKEKIDAVVVDKESVGSSDLHGCGAKILYGEGALEKYLSQQRGRQTVVRVNPSYYVHISNLCLVLTLTVLKTSVYYILCCVSNVYMWIFLFLCNLISRTV